MNERLCEWCREPLAVTKRSSARFCSRRCVNANYRVNGAKRSTPEQNREHALAAYHRRKESERLARGARHCPECEVEIPRNAHARKVFCSRRCINKASLRDRVAERRTAFQLRRARIKAANSPGVSERDWRRLLQRYGGRCAYCGSDHRITMDHIVPIARGGWHAIGNVLPACFSCNASKRDDLLIYWLNGRAKARLSRAHTRTSSAA